MSIDEALLALVREVRRVGAGEAVFRGHVSAHSWGGSVRQPSGGPHPEDGVDLSLLPALLGALPGPPRRCAVELQARADDRWQATLCWADDWDSFITPRRVLRETVEPAVPAAPEIPPVDDDLLAKRWAQVREQHDPRPRRRRPRSAPPRRCWVGRCRNRSAPCTPCPTAPGGAYV